MRVLIVQLAPLGDVVHAMPVVHDIRQAFPEAVIDWVVEPAFAPLARRVEGVHEVVACAMRRWRRAWWTAAVRAEWRALKARLQREPYDLVVDLQGLTESALVARLARGLRFAPANASEGTRWEAPAAWLADHAVRIEPRMHAVDRARVIVAQVLGRPAEGAPRYGLRVIEPERAAPRATVAFVHGGSRDDQLWPQTNWVQLGKRVIGAGWNIGLPQGSEAEQTHAEMIAAGLQYEGQMRVEVWPNVPIDKVLDRLAGTQGVIGVDGGLSHLAVALDLPHVQIRNQSDAWRTGPLPSHGRRFQVAVEARPAPGLEAVWSAWNAVLQAAST